jgi:hypothetical protein
MRCINSGRIARYTTVLTLVIGLTFFVAKAEANDAIAPAQAGSGGQTCDERASGFSVLLRSDFSDLGPLSCTHNSISSQGATLSWANNLLTTQNSASADGLLALDYTWYHGGDGAFLKGFSLGAYTQSDDTYQLQPSGSQLRNGYTLIPGGFGELALRSLIAPGIDNFRVREGESFVNTGTRSNSFVAEWIPTYLLGRYANLGLPNRVGSTALYYTVSPEFMVQYDHFDNGTKTAAIFSTHDEALRIGPQTVLQFVVDKDALPSEWPRMVREFLGSSSLILTNHESWDQYTGKEYAWTAISFNYTFPGLDGQPSHVGLSASYGFGNSDASGNLSKQAKLGLAVKF